mmetsp:Transcript_18792/g.71536  ORF Transcript_18792/g.71536 Transcript_18792/m.71536 type:complete len:390 (-) Transcript_18792:407-1576(-)
MATRQRSPERQSSAAACGERLRPLLLSRIHAMTLLFTPSARASQSMPSVPSATKSLPSSSRSMQRRTTGKMQPVMTTSRSRNTATASWPSATPAAARRQREAPAPSSLALFHHPGQDAPLPVPPGPLSSALRAAPTDPQAASAASRSAKDSAAERTLSPALAASSAAPTSSVMQTREARTRVPLVADPASPGRPAASGAVGRELQSNLLRPSPRASAERYCGPYLSPQRAHTNTTCAGRASRAGALLDGMGAPATGGLSAADSGPTAGVPGPQGAIPSIERHRDTAAAWRPAIRSAVARLETARSASSSPTHRLAIASASAWRTRTSSSSTPPRRSPATGSRGLPEADGRSPWAAVSQAASGCWAWSCSADAFAAAAAKPGLSRSAARK